MLKFVCVFNGYRLLCFFVDDKSENISKDNEKKSKQFKTLVQKILNFCTKLYNKGNRSIHLMACMIEFLTEHNEKDQELNEPIDIEKIKFALKVCIFIGFIITKKCNY